MESKMEQVNKGTHGCSGTRLLQIQAARTTMPLATEYTLHTYVGHITLPNGTVHQRLEALYKLYMYVYVTEYVHT